MSKLTNGTRRIPTISFCGVDGVGKTSILKMLAEDTSLEAICFVGRGPNDAESVVERYYPRSGSIAEWYEGPFNEAIAIACAIDYLSYFESVILPVTSGNSENQFVAIVTDRHTPCFKAFALINEKPSQIALDILSSIEEPDYIIYFNVDRELIESRAHLANEKFNEFEAKECQEKLLQAYGKVFNNTKSTIFQIGNTGDINMTCLEVKNIIKRILSSEI